MHFEKLLFVQLFHLRRSAFTSLFSPMGQVPEALQLGSRDGRRMVMRRGSGVALEGAGGHEGVVVWSGNEGTEEERRRFIVSH